ncbi:MAG TPA: SRPBCC family protein [Methylomirabilota bacterium]|jgi:uncharacterized membrane protein
MALVGGAGLGAGLMYLLDPDRGQRRRAQLGETMSGAAERLASPDVMSAVRGAGTRLGAADVIAGVREAGARLAASDAMAEVRRAARDPRAIRPAWRRGRLTLQRRSATADFLDRHRWSFLGVAAGILAAGVWGLWRREPDEVRESVTVSASPERVYEAWTRFENFPRFMPAVREVRSTGPDRTHWVISGPAGAPFEFESIVTRRQPPSAIAWRTVEGALVSHGGTARFRPAGPGATRVDVTMWWRPAGGGIGQGVATLSGIDPSHMLREGLDRFKGELEQGKHAAKR